jgi:hypothetical protein
MTDPTAMSRRAMRRWNDHRIKSRVRHYYGGYALQDPRQTGKLAARSSSD